MALTFGAYVSPYVRIDDKWNSDISAQTVLAHGELTGMLHFLSPRPESPTVANFCRSVTSFPCAQWLVDYVVHKSLC